MRKILFVSLAVAVAQIAGAKAVSWSSGGMGDVRYEWGTNDYNKISYEYIGDEAWYVLIGPSNIPLCPAENCYIKVDCEAMWPTNNFDSQAIRTNAVPIPADTPTTPPQSQAVKATDTTMAAILVVAVLLLVVVFSVSSRCEGHFVVLLLLGAGAALAAPPPQTLARTLPPDIVALVASNAPPGAHIRYRYHRAKPFASEQMYKRGDVVVAEDGTAYIATTDVYYVAPTPPPLILAPVVTPLNAGGLKLDMRGGSSTIDSTPRTPTEPQPEAPTVAVPPSSSFRVINVAPTNATPVALPPAQAAALRCPPARLKPLIQTSKPMVSTTPIEVSRRRVVAPGIPAGGALSARGGIPLPPVVLRTPLENAILRAQMEALIAEHGPRPKREHKVFKSAFFPNYKTITTTERL